MKKLSLNRKAKAAIGSLLSSLKPSNFSSLLFLALILFLPTQFGRHFWPEFSFIKGIRIDYLSPTLYLTDILILFLFVFSFFKNKFLITNYKILIILIAVVIAGIIQSKSPTAGFFGLLKLLEFVFLGFYTANYIKKNNFQNILLMLSLGVIFESLLAVAQYLNHGSIQGFFYFFGERFYNSQTPGIANASIGGELFLRPYGTFPHPNVLAGYLFVAMTMLIFNFQFTIFKFKKTLFTSALILGTVSLLLSLSRVAIILWVLVLSFFLIRKLMIKRIPLIIISILILVFLGTFTPLRQRFTDIRLTDESITQRESLVQSSEAMIKNHPIFGVGLNNFLTNLPAFEKVQPVHNIFLLVLSETGIVGISFFLWFLIKTIKKVQSSYLLLLVSCLLFLGIFDHYFLTLQQGQLLFAMVLGWCWSD